MKFDPKTPVGNSPVQVIMVRPETGSRLVFSIPQGTPIETVIETVIAENPGWQFAGFLGVVP